MTFTKNKLDITLKAVEVIKTAAQPTGIKATAGKFQNYGNVWARDSAVAGLSILNHQLTDLYPSLHQSLIALQKASNIYGQIPSNITLDNSGEITNISFGGPVGRTDCSFWWLVAAIFYLKQVKNQEFETLVFEQARQIINLSTCWEFNGKGLMYVPVSSNWADEYVTNGYVLYDQIIRYWAVMVAANYFNNYTWLQKASEIKHGIKQHFLFEYPLETSLYTEAQQKILAGFDISRRFIASFSPSQIIEKYDAWSLGLLLLLDIPSQESKSKINTAITHILNDNKNKGFPAFWPIIQKDDHLYSALQFNHSYNFKNKPGHFHNGGIWPVCNGFLIAGLATAGFTSTAAGLLKTLDTLLITTYPQNPFAEYYDFYNQKPGGVNNLCFSAAGYLIAKKAVDDQENFNSFLFYNEVKKNQFNHLELNADKIIDALELKSDNTVLITIAGQSGCGKTTLSKILKNKLSSTGLNVLILHQDDYFRLPPAKNHQARVNDFNRIGVHEVRWDLLQKHLKSAIKKTEGSIISPIVDWQTDCFKLKQISLKNIDIVIIEGTYTTLLENITHKIFIDTHFTDTKTNRIVRNRESVSPFIEKVLAKEAQIISQHQKLAHIILNNNFEIESKLTSQ